MLCLNVWESLRQREAQHSLPMSEAEVRLHAGRMLAPGRPNFQRGERSKLGGRRGRGSPVWPWGQEADAPGSAQTFSG